MNNCNQIKEGSRFHHVCRRIRLFIQIPDFGQFKCGKNQFLIPLHRWNISYAFCNNRWYWFSGKANGLYPKSISDWRLISFKIFHSISFHFFFISFLYSYTIGMVKIIASTCNVGTQVAKRGLYRSVHVFNRKSIQNYCHFLDGQMGLSTLLRCAWIPLWFYRKEVYNLIWIYISKETTNALNINTQINMNIILLNDS